MQAGSAPVSGQRAGPPALLLGDRESAGAPRSRAAPAGRRARPRGAGRSGWPAWGRTARPSAPRRRPPARTGPVSPPTTTPPRSPTAAARPARPRSDCARQQPGAGVGPAPPPVRRRHDVEVGEPGDQRAPVRPALDRHARAPGSTSTGRPVAEQRVPGVDLAVGRARAAGGRATRSGRTSPSAASRRRKRSSTSSSGGGRRHSRSATSGTWRAQQVRDAAVRRGGDGQVVRPLGAAARRRRRAARPRRGRRWCATDGDQRVAGEQLAAGVEGRHVHPRRPGRLSASACTAGRASSRSPKPPSSSTNEHVVTAHRQHLARRPRRAPGRRRPRRARRRAPGPRPAPGRRSAASRCAGEHLALADRAEQRGPRRAPARCPRPRVPTSGRSWSSTASIEPLLVVSPAVNGSAATSAACSSAETSGGGQPAGDRHGLVQPERAHVGADLGLELDAPRARAAPATRSRRRRPAAGRGARRRAAPRRRAAASARP